MSTFVLVNEEGDRQVVDSSATDGELAALMDSGYDFADESGEALVSLLADNGEGSQTVDHVPARNVRAYQADMSRATGRRPMIITTDSGVREYVDTVRASEARAERVRELGSSWEGLGAGLLSGVAALPVAAGQAWRQHVQGREPATEAFGYNLSELAEARPFAQTAGNIIGMIGTGGAGAIGGAGIRGAQVAGRFGASRGGQVVAGLAVEEALWTAGSTIPLSMMQGQPQLSGEALLGGAAFGGAVGLIAGPYLRGYTQARRAGERSLFREIAAAPGQGPMQQLIELNRNPPTWAGAAVTNPAADELTSLMMRLDFVPTALQREQGAPLGGSAGVAVHRVMYDQSFRRARIRSWAHGLSEQDINRYMDETFIRDNSIPASSTDPGTQSMESISQAVRDEIILPRLQRLADLDAATTQGPQNLRTSAYRDDVRAEPANARVAVGDIESSITELLLRFGNPTADGLAEARQSLNQEMGQLIRNRASDQPAGGLFNSLADRRRIHLGRLIGSQRSLLSDGAQKAMDRLLEVDRTLYGLGQRAQRGLSDENIAEELFGTMLHLREAVEALEGGSDLVPGLAAFSRNLGEVFAGTRDAAGLADDVAANGRAIFSDAVHHRFRTINAAYAARKPGGAFKRIMEKFEMDDVRPGTDKLEFSSRKLEEKLFNMSQRPEEYERFTQELMNDLRQVDNISDELADLVEKPDLSAAQLGLPFKAGVNQGQAFDKLEEFFRIQGNRGRHQMDLGDSAGKTPSSLATHAFSQALGGFIGTLIDPILGWVTGGSAAVASLAMRQLDSNPARALMMQGKIRNQLLDYNRRLNAGTAQVGKRMRSASRVVRGGIRGTRMAARGLGFAILNDTITRQERVDQYNSLRERLNTLANDPLALTDELEMSLSTVDATSPEVAHYMRERAVAGVMYLSQSMLPATTDPLFPSRVSVPPSMAEVDAFTRRFRALQDPLSILDDLANGLVTAEAAETVRIVYPNIMADISAGIGNEIMEMGSDAAHIPYQMRTNLSLMLGTPTGTTLDGSFIMAMNERFAQTPQQAEAQGLNRMRTRRLSVSSGFMTEAQALSER